LNPLHYAAEKGNILIVEYLVSQKADINAKNIDFIKIYMITLPFIMPLPMVILVLLNVLSAIKLILMQRIEIILIL